MVKCFPDTVEHAFIYQPDGLNDDLAYIVFGGWKSDLL